MDKNKELILNKISNNEYSVRAFHSDFSCFFIYIITIFRYLLIFFLEYEAVLFNNSGYLMQVSKEFFITFENSQFSYSQQFSIDKTSSYESLKKKY